MAKIVFNHTHVFTAHLSVLKISVLFIVNQCAHNISSKNVFVCAQNVVKSGCAVCLFVWKIKDLFMAFHSLHSKRSLHYTWFVIVHSHSPSSRKYAVF